MGCENAKECTNLLKTSWNWLWNVSLLATLCSIWREHSLLGWSEKHSEKSVQTQLRNPEAPWTSVCCPGLERKEEAWPAKQQGLSRISRVCSVPNGMNPYPHVDRPFTIVDIVFTPVAKHHYHFKLCSFRSKPGFRIDFSESHNLAWNTQVL